MPARRPSRRWRPAAIGAAAVVMLLPACTNSGRPDTGSGTASIVGGVATITIKTGPDRLFHPNTIIVHSGTVRLVMQNRVQHASGEPHSLAFDTFPAGTLRLIRPGQQTSVTFTAPAPGRYQFVCTIHAGQTGVMVVTR